ncbi:response regulator transcription factor [Alicyclobacillus sp. ALC3]|uniref:response regulator transcription factor n=1 Tax=Alicyclobacillus sp. ALC3 TaxID=2796143 RepID=UPI002378DD47|nr:response regulator transcription factor [Alicyclobacillus sp. ALC3]
MTGTIRVMIVDDSKDTRESVRLLLGFSSIVEVVVEAENGLVALEKLTHTQVDVVIMDVNMPEMDGITATTHIHQTYPQVAVVILSAEAFPEDLAQGLDAGAHSYLRKPVSAEALIAAVTDAHRASALAKRRLSRRFVHERTARSVRVQPMYSLRDPD